MKLIFGWVAITLTVIVVIALLPGLSVDWSAGVYSAIAASFAVLNVLLGWILTPLSVPFTALAWGSIAFAVNTMGLLITDAVMGSLHVDGIAPALIAAAIIAGVDLVIEGVSRSVRTSEARSGW